jgi:hypothetical protein
LVSSVFDTWASILVRKRCGSVHYVELKSRRVMGARDHPVKIVDCQNRLQQRMDHRRVGSS